MPTLALLTLLFRSLVILVSVWSGGEPPVVEPPVVEPPVTEPDDASPRVPPADADPAAPAAPASPANPARAILERARAATEGMSRFSADLRYVVEDVLEGRTTARGGRVLYERRTLEDGGDRLAVVFTSITENNRRRTRDRHYAIQGRWLAEVDRESRVFVKRAIAPAGERFDPFDLGEGGFPLPVGQDPDAVLAEFTAEPLALPTEGLLARLPREQAEGIRLVPRPGTPMAEDVSELELFYDRATGIPLGVRVTKGAKLETVLLSQIARDPEFTEDEQSRLSLEPPGEGWSVDIR